MIFDTISGAFLGVANLRDSCTCLSLAKSGMVDKSHLK